MAFDFPSFAIGITVGAVLAGMVLRYVFAAMRTLREIEEAARWE